MIAPAIFENPGKRELKPGRDATPAPTSQDGALRLHRTGPLGNRIRPVAVWGAAAHGRQRAEKAVAALHSGGHSDSRPAKLAAAKPGSLSEIRVQRAEEVDKLDKKIAYYCRLYAVSQVRFAVLAGVISADTA